MGALLGSKSRHNCFCAFCRTPRRLSRKRNISFVNVVASVLVSPLIMWLMWGGPDARVFVIFACVLGSAEYFVQVRWRLSVVCRACGFDPVLYVKDPRRAVSLVKAQLDKRKESKTAIFARPLNLPTVSATRGKELAKLEALTPGRSGQIVSRNV